jgi:heterotetrameric sarcosine oxidase gamma subunit
MHAARSALGSDFGAARKIRTIGGCLVTERSDIASVLISASFDGGAAKISARIGTDLPDRPGPIVLTGEFASIWSSPRSWVVQCAVPDEDELRARVESAFPDRSVHATLFGDYLCWMEIRGPDSLALLRRGAFLSFEREGIQIGAAKRTLVAEVNAIVARPEADRFLVGIERSRARYFMDWLLLAAR